MVVCLFVLVLRHAGDLSKVYHVSRPMVAWDRLLPPNNPDKDKRKITDEWMCIQFFFFQ